MYPVHYMLQFRLLLCRAVPALFTQWAKSWQTNAIWTSLQTHIGACVPLIISENGKYLDACVRLW